jgi:opacity protein-like surface antigen
MCVSSAAAQQKVPPPKRAPQPRAPIGFGGAVAIGTSMLAPSDSFDAVGLESSQRELGASARVTNLWRGLFVEGGGSRWSASGERAFIDSGGEVYPLGIPLDVEATAVDITAGWRFAPARRGFASRLTPYIGGGFGTVMYKERSPFAQPGDDVDEDFTSTHVLGGLEYRLAKWIAIAGEAKYRHVPDAIGAGGISEERGDDTLSGTSAAFRLVVGR